MKVWKLVSGILSIVLVGFIIFQSCAAGVSNALEENGEVSGSAGVIVAILILAGGIISQAAKAETLHSSSFLFWLRFSVLPWREVTVICAYGQGGAPSALFWHS